VRVLVQRPQHPSVALTWFAGRGLIVWLVMRRLATVATADGVVIEQVENPRPLDAALREAAATMPGQVALHERLAAVPRTHHRTVPAAPPGQ